MEFITYEQLERDIIDFSREIPSDIDVIVGVERSGLLPATLLALHLNKPLLTLNEYIHNVVSDYIDSKVSLKSVYKALIVDDSVSSGRTFQEINGILSKEKLVYKTAAIYISNISSYIPDYHYKSISIPRMFEWNFIHHEALKNAILDIDGVIFKEPPMEDDTAEYEAYIKNPSPLYIPSVPVFGFMSGRLEKYRKITEQTLKRYRVNYGFLELAQYDSPAERRKFNMGEKKGEFFRNSKATLFIESSKEQADIIRKISGKDVICIEEFRKN